MIPDLSDSDDIIIEMGAIRPDISLTQVAPHIATNIVAMTTHCIAGHLNHFDASILHHDSALRETAVVDRSLSLVAFLSRLTRLL